jgi:hypothetical protein
MSEVNPIIFSAGFVCAGLALILWSSLHRLTACGGTLPVTPEWIDTLSIDCYRPMMRLLDTGDVEFLRAQAGFTPAMVRQLRSQRVQVFKGYLRFLRLDFNRICAAIKLLMVQSRRDRPELAEALVRHQFLFLSGMLMVRFRLLLYRLGMGRVDVASLVRIFDVTRAELRSLVPAADFSVA